MLKFNAADFYNAASTLREIEASIAQWKDQTPRPDGVRRQFFVTQLEQLQTEVKVINLSMTEMSISSLISSLGAGPNPANMLVAEFMTYGRFADRLKEIDSRLRDELKMATLFAIPNSRIKYLEDPASFGQQVQEKFATAAFEIDEACKCFALGRSTAAVFHLMRTMEVGIRAVTRCFGIPDPTHGGQGNWGAMLRVIKSELDSRQGAQATKTWTNPADKSFFEGVYASLDAVRVAWRNPTMHVESKHTEDEAESILFAVRGFMKCLASRCDENGNPLV